MNPSLLAHFEEQAGFCAAYGSPFTAHLLQEMARDLTAGGPVADLVAEWKGSPRADAVSLRLTGALHAAVLSGRDPALAAVYPASSPRWDGNAVWAAARAFLASDRRWIESFLQLAPQTNESTRSIALLIGFLELARCFDLPMELFELGASAGLNVSWDQFCHRTHQWTWGPTGGPRIETRWEGPPPALDQEPRIRARHACDQNPLDIGDPAQRLRLRAYVWADQADRLARFDAAVALALRRRVRVERADAADWLEERLAARPEDALTVVYHSVFFQYPPPETRRRIGRAIAQAGESGTVPLAWLRLEPEAALGGPSNSARFLVDVITWPGGERRTLAETDGHARFVRVLSA